MTEELQKICQAFIADRDILKKNFKMEYDTVFPACANIFLSYGQTANGDRLNECKRIVKEQTGVFNNFRGPMFTPTCCLLSCSNDPAGKMARASENYKLLKEYFSATDQLVLAALLLTDLLPQEETRAIVEKGREVYRLMKEKHRFLTDQRDAVFAVLFAFSDRSNEEIIDDIERCYELLKPISGGDYIQTAAFILALSGQPAEEKCKRFEAILDGLRESGIKYGKYHELAVLSSLAVFDRDVSTVVSDITEISDFLATQKGYKGIFGVDRKTRLMHSAMLLSTYYAPGAGNTTAALTSMLAILTSQIILMICIVSSATAASVAVSAAH